MLPVHPPSGVWYLFEDAIFKLCKDKDSAPSSYTRPLLCPETHSSLCYCPHMVVICMHLSLPFCNFLSQPSYLPIFFFKCQCLTSMSCWLVFFQAIRIMEVPVVKIREGEAGSKEKMMIKSIVTMVQYCVCLSVWMTLWHFVGTLGRAAWPLIHTGYSFNHSAWLTYWCWTDLWVNIYNEFCVLLQRSQSNFWKYFKRKPEQKLLFSIMVSVFACV